MRESGYPVLGRPQKAPAGALKVIDILCKKYDNNYVTMMSYVIVLTYGNFFKMFYSSGGFRNYKEYSGNAGKASQM